MWLYEKYGIWTEASFGFRPKGFYWVITVIKNKKMFFSKSNTFQPSFNLPTEAYEAAIKYCLEKLIN